MRPASLLTWRYWDSLLDASLCTLPSRFRNFRNNRVSKPRRSGLWLGKTAIRTDSTALERLTEYKKDKSGNLNSPNNIANVLDANRVPTNHVTVGRYISYLRDAFVFYEARRYDIKGKKYLSTQAKHYVCDSGMRYAVLGTRDMDWGRMYENAAFLELMRRGYETYVGKLYQKEVDFVAKRGSELVYIQVGDDISSESTLERGLAPLLSVRDAFPKVLIARTRHEPYTREGVLVLDLARWLLGEQGF